MKCCYFKLAATLLGVLSLARAELKDKRQIETTSSRSKSGSQVGEKDFLVAIKEGSKYFQFEETPFFDRYKIGGFEDESEEKTLETKPHGGNLKSDVRWGDKNGGYGEHYFDYNHDGKDNDNVSKGKLSKSKQSSEKESEDLTVDIARDRRNLLRSGDVEFISDAAQRSILGGASGMHGGNYQAEETGRIKRENVANFRETDWVLVADE